MSLQAPPLVVTDLIAFMDRDSINFGEPIIDHLKNGGVELMSPIDYTGLTGSHVSKEVCINSLLALVDNNPGSLAHTIETQLNHDWLLSAHASHHHNEVCEDGHTSDFLPSASDLIAMQTEMHRFVTATVTMDELVTRQWLLSTYLDEKTSACDKDMILQLLITPSDLPAHSSQTVALVGTVPMDDISAVF